MKIFFDKSQNKYYKVIREVNLLGIKIPYIKECSKHFFLLSLETGISKLYEN